MRPSSRASSLLQRMTQTFRGYRSTDLSSVVIGLPVTLRAEPAKLFVGYLTCGERECPPISNLLRGAADRPERRPRQCAADTDPFDTDGFELGKGERISGQSHHDVDRSVDLLHQRSDGLEILHSGNVQAIGTDVAVQVRAQNRLLERFRMTDQIAFRPRRQSEGEAEGLGRLLGGTDAIDCEGSLIKCFTRAPREVL